MGDESVYVYFNPNDRELASLKGRSIWECKIGRTTIANPIPRILSQGAKTALSHPPVIGLVIRTNDAVALERALHAALRAAELEVEDSPGVEWFLTSPEHVQNWYELFERALSVLKNTMISK